MEGPEESLRFTDIPVIQPIISDTASNGEYEVSLLTSLSPEYLLGEPENPGPLVRLAYPEVLRLRLVSRKLRDLIDNDYFWELKTRRDFGVEESSPQEESWKAEYLRHAQALTPELLEAAKEGKAVQVRELLDLGVNPNVRDDKGYAVLIRASQKGHLEVVERLLDAGAEVNAGTRYGWNALMAASEEGHLEVVKLLLAKGAKVNAADKHGQTALITASWKGHTEIVKLLLAKGAKANAADAKGNTSLVWASRKGHREVVDLLKTAGAG